MRPRGMSWQYLAVPLLLAFVVAGCTGSGVTTQPPASVTVTTSATPTPTTDPRAQPAVTAYENFRKTATNSQRHPVPDGQPYPAGADFTKYSFDPIRAQYETYIWSLATDGTTFRGTPPQLHVRVQSVDLQKKPWPTVLLSDCETGTGWHGYDKSGKRLAETKPTVSPPYELTLTMIFYQNHWGVQKVASDVSRTCTG